MSPASSRSTSISSSSKNNTTVTTTPDPAKKKFACSFPACGKAFSRSEHLHRHALNHKDGNNTCLRCSAHFRRRDLLDRHMARHKEKDDEAGGAGLGILATRKRLWRDAAGNIVNARRPSYTQDGNSNNSSNKQRRQTVSSGRVEKKSSASHTSTRSNPRRGIHALTTTAAAAAAAALPSPTESLAGTGRLGDSENETIIVEMQKYEYPDPDEDGPKISLGDESTSSASWLEMQHLPSPPTTSRSSLSLPSEAQSPSAGDLSDLEGLYEESSATWGAPPSLHEHHHDVLGARGLRLASVGGGDEIYGSGSSCSWGSGASQHPHHQLAHTHPLHQHHQHPHHHPHTHHHQPSFQTFMGAMAELPYDDIFKPEAGLYEWQAWNQNVLLSRCREEKYEPGSGLQSGAGLGAAVYAGAAAAETAATGAEAGSAGSSLSRAFELGSC